MTLELFLKILINELEANNIEYCILRNYNTLPAVLKKGDIDFLVSDKQITRVEDIIKSMRDIYIIGVTRRKYVHNYFIFNIDKGGDSRALQIDFIFKYIYKGISYLDIPYLLNNTTIVKNKSFRIPNRFDKVFFMFFPFYLSTGTLNKKYENMIISIFKEHPEEFKNFFLKLGFDIKFIDNFYDKVVNGDYKLLKEFSRKIKIKIFFNNFSVLDILNHYIVEVLLRIPFTNSAYMKVNLNPKNIKEIHLSLESFAKNIIFIELNSIFDYLKLFKIQTNFTMYVFYRKDNDTNTMATLNEIKSFMPLQEKD